MNRVSDSAAPMVQVFSLSDYNEQQRLQASQQQAEVRLNVKEAKQKLSGGNLREAVASFSKAKAGGFYRSDEKSALSRTWTSTKIGRRGTRSANFATSS